MKTVTLRNNGIFSDKSIPQYVFSICRTLHKKGFRSFIVGGCIRDLLLDIVPKDFDIVTSASYEEIKDIFKRRCRIVGKRFKLAHIYGPQGAIVELTSLKTETGLLTMQEDASRRDITINALYYEPESRTIFDYCGGLRDIERKRISMINDAHERVNEDPVRMLRIIRYAAKTGFDIEPLLYSIISQNSELITTCSSSRLYEEIKKDLLTSKSAQIYSDYVQTGLFHHLYPALSEIWNTMPDFETDEVFMLLEEFDDRQNTCLFLAFSCLLFPFFKMLLSAQQEKRKMGDLLKLAESILEPVSRAYQMPRLIVNKCRFSMAFAERTRQTLIKGKLIPSIQKKNYFKESVEFYDLLSQVIPDSFPQIKFMSPGKHRRRRK